MQFRVPLVALAVSAGALLSPAAVSAQQDLVTALSTIEQSLWEGWKNHDSTPFEANLAEPALNLSATGMDVGRDAEIKSIAGSDCDVKGYSFSDWAVHPVTPDVAILTYRAKQDGVCGGKALAPEVLVSAVYVKKGGKWMSASYHETPVATRTM